MYLFFRIKKIRFLRKWVALMVATVFMASTFVSVPFVRAETILNLPTPGTMVTLTQGYQPILMKGISISLDNPLKFDFIINTGSAVIDGDELWDESRKLIRYFLTGLTIPEEDLWVNLSPYENNRIIPQDFGFTELGRDLLAQDYMLKQLTASLMYPEKELGADFWDRVHQKALEKFGTVDIPMNTFSKIWIVPDKATIYEHQNNAFLLENHLKVMLEEDFVALAANLKNEEIGLGDIVKEDIEDAANITSDVVREVLIPEIEREVNEGKVFAKLRQISDALVLATWYKRNLKNSLLGQIYVDQNKTLGIDIEDKDIKHKIYNQYLEAFKKGVYDYMREDYDPASQQVIPRKYFSGGYTQLGSYDKHTRVIRKGNLGLGDEAMLAKFFQPSIDGKTGKNFTVKGILDSLTEEAAKSMEYMKSLQTRTTTSIEQYFANYAPVRGDAAMTSGGQLDLVQTSKIQSILDESAENYEGEPSQEASYLSEIERVAMKLLDQDFVTRLISRSPGIENISSLTGAFQRMDHIVITEDGTYEMYLSTGSDFQLTDGKIVIPKNKFPLTRATESQKQTIISKSQANFNGVDKPQVVVQNVINALESSRFSGLLEGKTTSDILEMAYNGRADNYLIDLGTKGLVEVPGSLLGEDISKIEVAADLLNAEQLAKVNNLLNADRQRANAGIPLTVVKNLLGAGFTGTVQDLWKFFTVSEDFQMEDFNVRADAAMTSQGVTLDLVQSSRIQSILDESAEYFEGEPTQEASYLLEIERVVMKLLDQDFIRRLIARSPGIENISSLTSAFQRMNYIVITEDGNYEMNLSTGSDFQLTDGKIVIPKNKFPLTRATEAQKQTIVSKSQANFNGVDKPQVAVQSVIASLESSRFSGLLEGKSTGDILEMAYNGRADNYLIDLGTKGLIEVPGSLLDEDTSKIEVAVDLLNAEQIAKVNNLLNADRQRANAGIPLTVVKNLLGAGFTGTVQDLWKFFTVSEDFQMEDFNVRADAAMTSAGTLDLVQTSRIQSIIEESAEYFEGEPTQEVSYLLEIEKVVMKLLDQDFIRRLIARSPGIENISSLTSAFQRMNYIVITEDGNYEMNLSTGSDFQLTDGKIVIPKNKFPLTRATESQKQTIVSKSQANFNGVDKPQVAVQSVIASLESSRFSGLLEGKSTSDILEMAYNGRADNYLIDLGTKGLIEVPGSLLDEDTSKIEVATDLLNAEQLAKVNNLLNADRQRANAGIPLTVVKNLLGTGFTGTVQDLWKFFTVSEDFQMEDFNVRADAAMTTQLEFTKLQKDALVQLFEESSDGVSMAEMIDYLYPELGSVSLASPSRQDVVKRVESYLQNGEEGDPQGSQYELKGTVWQKKKVGGIILNPAFLDLQIQRDNNGIPLPVEMQPVHDINVQGFFPVIIEITPVTNMPQLLGFSTKEAEQTFALSSLK